LWQSVANASRDALRIRYTLLPYLYTQFHASSETGRAVWRPLFFDFPSDETASRIDRQILIGNAIMISPVLEPHTTSVHAYFPVGRWFDWYTHEKILDTDNGVFEELNAPLDKIPVHVRGGHVVPLQAPEMTIHKTSQGPLSVLIALDSDDLAHGTLYYDDGISVNVSDAYTLADMNASGSSLKITGTFGFPHKFDKIIVLGASRCVFAPSTVWINRRAVVHVQSELKSATGTLNISGLNITLSQDTMIEWRC
jgi:alpha-glucosidase